MATIPMMIPTITIISIIIVIIISGRGGITGYAVREYDRVDTGIAGILRDIGKIVIRIIPIIRVRIDRTFTVGCFLVSFIGIIGVGLHRHIVHIPHG